MKNQKATPLLAEVVWVCHDIEIEYPTLNFDLLLAHPPAHFDFRNRGDIYFPYLSTSGDVPITPLYEYFPLGFKTLQRSLGLEGHDVRIINLSSVLLKYPATDLKKLFRALDIKLFGLDLHWMVHAQGALAIAELFKSVHPEVPIIFGGISSTYYADELIRYPFIDMVMRGYDTLAPMNSLLESVKKNESPRGVPNLLWKNENEVVDNSFNYIPETYGCGIDWTMGPKTKNGGFSEILSTQHAGCSFNCGWCGGSRDAFRRINGKFKSIARKPAEETRLELESMKRTNEQKPHHFYSVGIYNEAPEQFNSFVDMVGSANFKSVSYEQFHLTSDNALDAMVKANPKTMITLSPESSDLKIAKLAGRGVYTPDQMETWIHKALDKGIFEIDVWYFIGMPEQDESAVFRDVDYCKRLLTLFKGERVVPLICPMIPLLDPASNFFERPDQYGYKTFFRTVEEHRQGAERASLINRVNYETKWLSRAQLVDVGYRAVRRLTEIKGEIGFLPSGVASHVIARIDEALKWIKIVDEIDNIKEAATRRREFSSISKEIMELNNGIFFDGVSNQSYPINREIGSRWFDEFLFNESVFLEGRA